MKKKSVSVKNINMNKEDAFIRTYTGGKVYFFNPERSNIDLLDIFHPLALLCRFNGATKVNYSVAQHSVLVADEVFKQTGDKNLAYQAISHDFAEAFISDVPSPFKQFFEGFKEMEIKMEEWLSKLLGFQYPFDPIIKIHDLKALSTEMRDLMVVADNKDLPEPYPEKIVPLSWVKAQILISRKFHEYKP